MTQDKFMKFLNERKRLIEEKITDKFYKKILLDLHSDYVEHYVCLKGK